MSIFNRNSVEATAEFRRVRDLRRRKWTEAELGELAVKMTALLKTPKGTMKLKPMQALALHDLYCYGGLFAPIRVGGGKTLISLLAAYMVNARRPLLLLPACLIGKTNIEMKQMQEHWRIPSHIRMMSYEMLGLAQSAEFLDGWKPDLIIGDECQKVKNRKVARTRRIVRYAKDYPDTKFVWMSGTMMKHSIRDFSHLLRFSLGDGAPVPSTEGETVEWADALDENVNPLQRRQPGALLQLCNAEEAQAPPLQAARLGFQRRLLESPGIVATTGEQVACSLYVRALPYTLAPILEKYYVGLRGLMVTPDGWDLMMATEVWMHARQLALGFHSVWDPRPPEPWRQARKAWAKFVREAIADSTTLDTEAQVKEACRKSSLGDAEFNAWSEIEPSFTPAPKDIWHDDAARLVCRTWMEKNPGIVWAEHVFFAEDLARRTGAPYYRQDGKDKFGNPIEKADCSKSIIASFRANKEGRNLQGRPPSQEEPLGWRGFSRNLVTSMPAGADDVEQMIGRTHRDGQMADEVIVDVLVGCKEHAEAFYKARAGAEAARDTLGQTQKLLLADVVFPSEAEIETYKGFRWRAPTQKEISQHFSFTTL